MKLIVEGLDRTGKDTLIAGVQDRRGYHLPLHFQKPPRLRAYEGGPGTPERRFQEASFRAMFAALRAPGLPVVCNRGHLGECVYAPLYRGYAGDYVFDLEREAQGTDGAGLAGVRLVLLVEDLAKARHHADDGAGFGRTPDERRREQDLFLEAFARSTIVDKRVVSVTDAETGGFRLPADVLRDAIGPEETP